MAWTDSHPNLLAQWSLKNTVKAADAIKAHKYIWDCQIKTACGCTHEWTATLQHRLKGSGCPFCSSAPKRVCPHNSLAFKFPEVAAQWHMNGDLTPQTVAPRSGKQVQWLCPETNCEAKCQHIWTTSISNRTGETHSGCPFCSGLQYCPHNSLAGKFPALAAQWHPKNNGDLLPTHVSPYSHKRVAWSCPETNCEAKCEHVWIASIDSRSSSQQSGCLFCCNPPRAICSHNSLGSKFPTIAKEWHATRNGTLTALTVTVHSGLKVWWTCKDCGKDWRAHIRYRTRESGSNCPHCCANKGERYLREELAKIAGITVNEQAKFDDLRDKMPLRYDATVKHLGLKRLVVIEADGVLHFPHLLFSESEQLPQDTIDGIRRDIIKNKHCKKHGFHMLRIGMYHLNAKHMAIIIPKFLSDCAAYEQKNGADATEGLYHISDKELYMAMREFMQQILRTNNGKGTTAKKHSWRRKRKRKQAPSADDPDPL